MQVGQLLAPNVYVPLCVKTMILRTWYVCHRRIKIVVAHAQTNRYEQSRESVVACL